MPPKRKRAAPSDESLREESPEQLDTPLGSDRDATPTKRNTRRAAASSPAPARERNAEDFSTPTAKRTLATRLTKDNPVTPSKLTTPRRNAVDRSAKRKTNQRQLERVIAAEGTEDEEDEEDQLADEIIGKPVDENDNDEEAEDDDEDQELATEAIAETPVKRGRGRPKGSKNREITPPTDLPAHEWYFWINRPNGLKTSTNTFPTTAFLDHSTYFETSQAYRDPHAEHIKKLEQHYVVDYDFWNEILLEGYNIILFGLGNKFGVLKGWADWLHAKFEADHGQQTTPPSKTPKKGRKAVSTGQSSNAAAVEPPITIVLDANHPALTARTIFSTIANSALPSDIARTMPNQPTDSVKSLLKHLTSTSSPTASHVYLLINPIHAPVLTHAPMPNLLAELSQHPRVHILAAGDDPHFPLLWSQDLSAQYNWIYCNGATFASYDDGNGQIGGVGVVDTVNELLGRKGARGKGREGVRWVLRSLPENARQVYRILVSEILSAESDGTLEMEVDMDEVLPEDQDEEMSGMDDNEFGGASGRSKGRKPARPALDTLPVISYKMLYSKSVEEFLTSSEMGFRGLLKEFVDHQMVVIRRDVSGQEAIGIDMRRDELEGVLEDLLLTE